MLAVPTLAYLLFIVYGSLLPFDQNGLAFATAWENFQHIRLLQLGVADRADWVANLLLYIPFGFMLCGWLLGKQRNPLALLSATLAALLMSAALALGVEFLQQFFPPRTVSLNDIYAEFAGAALGIVLWPVIGARLMRLVRTIFQGGEPVRQAALTAYALVYVAMILFPYDFLLSSSEWQTRLASDKLGWLFASNCGHSCVLRLIPEMLTIAPLGMLSALVFGPLRRIPLTLAVVVGLLIGALIEGLQLTIASGIGQGASVGAKALGIVVGVALIQSTRGMDWRWARHYIQSFVVLASVPYLSALAWLNHWFSARWLGWPEGWVRLSEIHFLPFYYHYYTTEAVALVSLLFQMGIYFPVGAGFWLWRWADSSHQPNRTFVWPIMVAGILASVIEAGKLFIPQHHPDPTNVLIAAVAAMMACRLLDLIFTATSESDVVRTHSLRDPTSGIQHSFGRKAIGVAALCAATGAALTSPLGGHWVLPSFVAYAALLWWRPNLWLIWVLALLPLLDLTPWSGRLFWSEYDSLLVTTIGMAYLRLPSRAHIQPMRWPAQLLLTLFVLSTVISLGIGLLPLGALDQNAFASYLSSYNALRVAKGLLFALALIPLLRHEWEEPVRAARHLALGMTLGLIAVVFYVLWERATFPGLFNFETDYRVTGPFPGMHVGGAYIECYLAVTLPFVVFWAWQQRRIWATLLATGLYGLGAYSVMVTFSRGGQAAFALATLLLLFGFARLALQDRVRRLTGVVTVALIACVALAIAWPVLNGKYSQSRLAASGQDLVTRTDHWANALKLIQMRSAAVFGLGLGSFPSAYFWGSERPLHPASYSFLTQNGNTFLRLGGGDVLYFEQPVALVPEQHYTLTMDLRSNIEQAVLTVPICEKALLYSFTCRSTTVHIEAPVSQWKQYKTEIVTNNFGLSNSLFLRPIKFSLYNDQAGTLVEIDNISLRDSAGNHLIRNGDFSSGMAHWFFSTDSHLPWHVKNLYLHIFFEQGWFGLVCFMVLIAYALMRWTAQAWNNEPLSLVLCASFSAFLMIGLIDSLIDETRISFLFYLLLIVGLVADTSSTPTLQTTQKIGSLPP